LSHVRLPNPCGEDGTGETERVPERRFFRRPGLTLGNGDWNLSNSKPVFARLDDELWRAEPFFGEREGVELRPANCPESVGAVRDRGLCHHVDELREDPDSGPASDAVARLVHARIP